MCCDVLNGGIKQIIMMNPFDPNGVSLEMYIPDEFGKEAVVARFDVKETQPSFSFGETNSVPFHQSRFSPQCIASPKEITANTGDLLDNNLRERKNVQPKLNHAIED